MVNYAIIICILLSVKVVSAIPDYQYRKYANQYNISHNMIKAIIRVESNFNPIAKSPDGSIGLMQVQCPTARDMGIKNCNDLNNPEINIVTGLKYIRYLQQRYMHLYKSLDAYNRGMVNAEKYPYTGNWRRHKYVGKIICIQEVYDGSESDKIEQLVEGCFDSSRYKTSGS